METLLDLLQQFPARQDKTAIVYRTGIRRFSYSYQEIYKLALQAASYFEGRGVKPGDHIVVWAPNSPWWVIAYWGIVANGAVIVPVDFMSGKSRVEKIVELVSARLIIQSRYKLDKLTNQQSVIIEDLEYILGGCETKINLPLINPSQTVEIIYTSGTTSDPKGVLLTHQNIVADLLSVNQSIKLDENHNFLSLLPLSHMFEQTGGMLTPLYLGSTVIYLKTLKPTAITEALESEDVWVVMLVPRLLQVLKNGIEHELERLHLINIFKLLLKISTNWQSSFKRKLFYLINKKLGSNFRFFVSGGAPLQIELAKFWQGLGLKIIEGYGLTECSPILTVNEIDKPVIGSVGKVVPGVELVIENGEILARGKNVFSGYYQSQTATQEAFNKAGWFKTGDLGSIDTAGNVYIRGRRKEMIVTPAGVNIYPDDLEIVLNRTRGVKEACVVGLDRGAGEEVHAVIILESGNYAPEKIIQEANTKLDQTQQLTSFTIWPELNFPKTATFKIQKFKVKQLIQPGQLAGRGGSDDKMVTLIAQVTNKPIAEISEQSILAVDLGLTSLARLELVNYLEQEFRVDLEDTAINQYTTVADLRSMIERRTKAPKQPYLRLWTNTKLISAWRHLIDSTFHRRLFKCLVDLEVKGMANLELIKEPVIYVSNHLSYFDVAAILYALPLGKCYQVAPAAGDEFFFQPGGGLLKKIVRRLMYEYVSVMFNAFILPEKAGFRQAIKFMGKLLDRGVSIIYFPEGGLTRAGQELPYQLGIGLIAQELKMPVVPVRLIGLGDIIQPDTAKMQRGKATVVFGQPLRFTTETTMEIVAEIKQAISSLG
ncbi:MAG: AMP-binding protein [Candidatus Kerfeldbacteria bacterium]|nr:AMP-binding protein [Candidatus Kerfeldbacteria bacterium]